MGNRTTYGSQQVVMRPSDTMREEFNGITNLICKCCTSVIQFPARQRAVHYDWSPYRHLSLCKSPHDCVGQCIEDVLQGCQASVTAHAYSMN